MLCGSSSVPSSPSQPPPHWPPYLGNPLPPALPTYLPAFLPAQIPCFAPRPRRAALRCSQVCPLSTPNLPATTQLSLAASLSLPSPLSSLVLQTIPCELQIALFHPIDTISTPKPSCLRARERLMRKRSWSACPAVTTSPKKSKSPYVSFCRPRSRRACVCHLGSPA